MPRATEFLARIVALVALVLAGSGCPDKAFTLGPNAELTIQPIAIGFGSVVSGTVKVRKVTVHHSGTEGTIRLDPIELRTQSPELELGASCPEELSPGETCHIEVVYSPEGYDWDDGQLVIGHRGLGQGNQTVIEITTVGLEPQLLAAPMQLDFGEVDRESESSLEVKLDNIGFGPATITGVGVQQDEDGDFSCHIEVGTVIEPNESATLECRYKPSKGAVDEGLVVVLTEREAFSVEIPIRGEERSPWLIVTPEPLELGWVEPGTKKLLGFELSNGGRVDLEISAMELIGDGEQTILTGSGAGGGVTLAPGEKKELGVIFEPQAEVPLTAMPLAVLQVASNDPRGDLVFPVYGAAGTPRVGVEPPDVLDFRAVAEGYRAVASVVVSNIAAGGESVIVSGAALADLTTTDFAFDNPEALPATLAAGESVALKVAFDNPVGFVGSESAALVISTDDPLVPEYRLELAAARTAYPTCDPRVIPEVLDIGAVREGTSGTGTVRVMNFGSGNCTYREHDAGPCDHEIDYLRHIYDCDSPTGEMHFEVLSTPATETDLPAAGYLELEVAFHAPKVKNVAFGRDDHYARLRADVYDPHAGKLRELQSEALNGVNLRAQSALPKLMVFPTELDFGDVRTDCSSDVQLLRIVNPGPFPATLDSAAAPGCGGAVSIEGPSLPLTLGSYSTVYLEAYFQPVEATTLACGVELAADSPWSNLGDEPTATVVTAGRGIDVTHHIDTFTQAAPPKVDVLFVVDDSCPPNHQQLGGNSNCTMTDEQQRLEVELPKFVQAAATWAQSYQLAVTTTDPVKVDGLFQGSPRVYDSEEPTSLVDFAHNMVVGITGSHMTAGLGGAWSALNGVHMADTDIECLANVPGQCPLYGDGNLMLCSDGFCRGPNAGFLRDDAELMIIVASDKEDHSPESISWYVQNLIGLKKGTGAGVTLHALVVPEDGCDGGAGGEVGMRYIGAASALGGHVASICGADLGAELAEIGTRTFGLRERFFPTLPVDPETLVLRVDGVECPADNGWEWNAGLGAVVLLPEGVCWPAQGETLEVEYDVACGDGAS